MSEPVTPLTAAEIVKLQRPHVPVRGSLVNPDVPLKCNCIHQCDPDHQRYNYPCPTGRALDMARRYLALRERIPSLLEGLDEYWAAEEPGKSIVAELRALLDAPTEER
jgi:hypothetical protein